jgi:hypothetical protein
MQFILSFNLKFLITKCFKRMMRYKACTIYWLVGKKYQMHEKKYTDSLNEGPTQQQVMSQLVITSEVKCYSVFTWASSTLIILFSEMSTF